MPRRALLLAAVLLAAPAAAAADELAQLLTLHGERAAVRYTPGSLDRAAHVQRRLALLAKDFSGWGGRPTVLRALVLSPEDWRAAGLRRPYGLPERTAHGELAAPAWGSEETVAFWREALGGGPLPWGGGQPVRGTTEEAASLALADILMQVECGRLFVAAHLAPGGGSDGWVPALAAHVVALVAASRHEPAQLPAVTGFWERIAARRPADDWLGREARLFAGARLVVARDGEKAVKRLLRLAAPSGRLTAGALLGRYPDLTGLAGDSHF